MKYEEFKYKRPDIIKIEKDLLCYLEGFRNASSSMVQKNLILKVYKLFKNFESMTNLAYLKSGQNIENKSYEIETQFFDNNIPKYLILKRGFYTELVRAKYKSHLKEYFGGSIFRFAGDSIRIHNPKIEEELKIENQLVRKYERILASAKIPNKRGYRSLNQTLSLMESPNRNTRRNSYHSFYNYFLKQEKEFDNIFIELVKVRDRISRKAGFNNYAEYSFVKYNRSYLTPKRISVLRNNTIKYLVPVLKTIRAKQVINLGLNKFKVYDSIVIFKKGNPKPIRNRKLLFENYRTMFGEFSPETGHFYDMLIKNNLLDYSSRKGKDVFYSCTFLYEYKSPFIFINFCGTQYDILSFIHEFGHAFQFHCCRDFEIIDYIIPFAETTELPSTCLEYLTLPWMNRFFRKETEKYVHNYICTSLKSIIFQVMGDEFQDFIYRNPDKGIDEIKNKWKELHLLYFGNIDYDRITYLERGSGWQLIRHFFISPLFLLDYTIASICGFQYLANSKHDIRQNIKNYVKLCKAGGSISFGESLKIAGLHSPFEEKYIKSIARSVSKLQD